MRILGIDPGLTVTGWGVIQTQGSRLIFRAAGQIRTQSSCALSYRLSLIHEGIADVIKNWAPDTAALEETFVNKNPAAALKLGQARGVALAVPALYGLEVSEYSANTVKKSVVGSGHAAKEQVQAMIKVLLPTCGRIGADAADALAVAICHAHYKPVRLKLSDKAGVAAQL